jgi:hypothetical protein
VLAVALFAVAPVDGRKLLRAQQPDTTCGKGFEKLVPGSKKYFKTAEVKLFTHPGRWELNGTVEKELQCWFAAMCTDGCGDLPSQYSTRNKALTETCLDYKKDWLAVWDLFTQGEFKWYKGMFPAEEIDPSEEEHGVTLAGKKDTAETKVAAAAETKVYYSEAMKTMKELTKKEMLCLTLFTIDDECVKHEYIRLA